MEIIKLSSGGKAVEATAKVFNSKGGKVYYNLGNGLDEVDFHRYKICLKEEDFKDIAKLNRPNILLDRKDYFLKAVYNKAGLYRDRLNNTRYNLGIEKDTTTYDTTLVIWEIPNFHYVDVEYKIVSGNVEVIGEGINGIDRGGIKYKSPAPILEIEGDVVIKWSGKDKKGDSVGEILTRVNNIWTASPLESGDK